MLMGGSVSGSTAVLALPLVACVLSALPPAYLGLVARVVAGWPAAWGNVGLAAKAFGAAALGTGHAVLCVRKEAMAKGDLWYFAGIAALVAFFGGNWIGAGVPLAVVGAGGLALLGFFGPPFYTSVIKGRAQLLTQVALTAALTGCASLAYVGFGGTQPRLGGMAAAASFGAANLIMLFLNADRGSNHALPFALKVLGSAVLVGANGIAYGWHTRAALAYTPTLLGQPLTEQVHAHHATVLAIVLAATPLLLAVANIAAPADLKVKMA